MERMDLGGSFVTWERERERERAVKASKGVLEMSFPTTTHPEHVL